MKAVIRNRGETIIEGTPINIDWENGIPLTDPTWPGGPFTLIRNYVPEAENDLGLIQEMHEQLNEEETEPAVEDNDDDYVVIDGKRYNKEELRALL